MRTGDYTMSLKLFKLAINTQTDIKSLRVTQKHFPLLSSTIEKRIQKLQDMNKVASKKDRKVNDDPTMLFETMLQSMGIDVVCTTED